jgi:hypothetical protein
MTKLIDTLQRPGKAGGPSIGFAGKSSTKTKAAAIIVKVAASESAIEGAVAAGADVIVLDASESGDAARAAQVTWGYDLRGKDSLTVDDLKSLKDRGADFVLLPQSVLARALSEPVEQLERVLLVAPPPVEDPMMFAIRALNMLDIEATVLDLKVTAKELAEMTLEHFAKIRLMCETLRFPVIVTVQDLPARHDIYTLAKLSSRKRSP